MQCLSWAVRDDYCFRCLSSLTMPPSMVLLDSSWRILSPGFFRELSLIDYVHRANTRQDGQSVMSLSPIETYFSSICYHQPSWKLSSHLGMHPIVCRKRLIIVCLMFFSMDSSHLVKSDLEKTCIGIINDVQFITHIHAMKCAFELQNRWSHN
jgi:hypothetical protein